MDGDGRLDLLTGSDNCCDREPGIFWFRGERNGRYTPQPKVRVRVGAVETFMPQFRATLADWDGDGRLEIAASLTGTPAGIYRTVGVWSVAAKTFARRPAEPASEISAIRPVEGSPRVLFIQPCVVDWDNDGRLDLIDMVYGHQGFTEVVWHRNIASSGDPRLGRAQPLVTFPLTENPVGISASDWDCDGWPDLLVGYIRSKAGGSYEYLSAGIRVYPRQ